MGFPSQWVEVLDEDGKKVTKLDRNGDVIREKDGSIRYQKRPQGQGLIDWIEDQKEWLAAEMLRRYGWEREYKDSHPRGNLSTPDYKVARAEERVEEMEAWMDLVLGSYDDRIRELSAQLAHTIDQVDGKSTRREMIDRYLDVCPDETYYDIVEEAVEYLHSLPDFEYTKATQTLQEMIHNANIKAMAQETREKNKEQTQMLDCLK